MAHGTKMTHSQNYVFISMYKRHIIALAGEYIFSQKCVRKIARENFRIWARQRRWYPMCLTASRFSKRDDQTRDCYEILARYTAFQ